MLTLLRAVFGAFPFAGGYGLIRIHWGAKQVMLGGHPIDPFFIELSCVFLIAFGILALVALFWEWVGKWRWVQLVATPKTHKFRDLYDEIRARRDELNNLLDSKVASQTPMLFISKIEELVAALRELAIPVPNEVPDLSLSYLDTSGCQVWTFFLLRLAGCARTGDLKRARGLKELTKEVSKE